MGHEHIQVTDEGAPVGQLQFERPDQHPDFEAWIAGSSNGGYATVAYREVLEAISITLIPAGIRLRFSGAFGRSCNIERAMVATGPWTTIDALTRPVSGLINYLDASPPAGRAFYRASEP